MLGISTVWVRQWFPLRTGQPFRPPGPSRPPLVCSWGNAVTKTEVHSLEQSRHPLPVHSCDLGFKTTFPRKACPGVNPMLSLPDPNQLKLQLSLTKNNKNKRKPHLKCKACSPDGQIRRIGLNPTPAGGWGRPPCCHAARWHPFPEDRKSQREHQTLHPFATIEKDRG